MADEPTTDRAKQFIKAHDAKFKPLDKRAGIAWWDANTSGKDEDFARKEEAQNAIDAALADPKAFAELKELKQAKDKGQIDDKTVARCIEWLSDLVSTSRNNTSKNAACRLGTFRALKIS